MDPLVAIMPPRGFGDAELLSQARKEGALEEFEAMFVKELLKIMRQSLPEGGVFQNTPAMETYEEMLDGAIAKSVAESGQLGIGKAIAAEIDRQEQAQLDTSEQYNARRALAQLKESA